MSHSIRTILALSLAFALGCEKKTKAKEGEPAEAKPTASQETTVDTATKVDPSATAPGQMTSTPQKPPEVILKEPGAEPRQELRLKPKVGDKQKMVMVMKTAMEMQMGGVNNPPVKLPAMQMVMDMSVEGVTPDGDINYKFVLSDTQVLDEAGVMPQVKDAMSNALSSAKGLTGNGVMSSRGFNKGTKIDIPANANPQVKQILEGMKDSFNQIAAPLPAEPVGPGAKWDVKMTIQQQGMSLEQVASYELISIKGTKVKAKSTVSQNAANQKIVNPSMPNLKLDLIKLKADGTGTVTFELDKLVPPEANGDIHSDASMAVDMGGQKQNMSMKMDVNVKVSAK